MVTFASAALYAGTPSLTAYGPRGLPVREVQCHREEIGGRTELRITQHQYDAIGHLSLSLDPRLAQAQPDDQTIAANFRWHRDLVGRTLRTESVDAGTRVVLPDAAGRSLLTVDATGTRHAFIHEGCTLPGRLLAVTEQALGQAQPRVVERYHWASLGQEEKNHNLSGHCVRHYGTSGLTELHSRGLGGVRLTQACRLILGEEVADWAGDNEQEWQARLDPQVYLTRRTSDATGAQLTQVDACGHLQRSAYDVAGQLQGTWLTLQGQAEQMIVGSLHYSAMGHKERETHGNGVVTDYRYDPYTQRLTGIRVRRPATARSRARMFQDLHYAYDPVGNVLSVRNDVEVVRFWRNQKVSAGNQFVYDSLYQLVQATGRELSACGVHAPESPAALVLSTVNDGTYCNYTRHYRYDSGGNLTQVQHVTAARHNHTTRVTVSDRSNRAVLAREGLLPEHVDALFDTAGRQRELLPGQALHWNARGELAQVRLVARESGNDDREWYRYGSDGVRSLKVCEHHTAGVKHLQRVVYLDGLELRNTFIGDRQSESLHIVRVGEGSGGPIRVLHWESSSPPGISNDQVRYSYHDLVGSTGLELDGQGNLISQEEYYPYGGTAVWIARSQLEAQYKTIRYSAKERDATGLYYYGRRYYQPWLGRWLSADPAGAVDGLNLFRMVRNNPVTLHDPDGMNAKEGYIYATFSSGDTANQIAGYNLTRFNQGKAMRPVIVRDDVAKAELQAVIQREIVEWKRIVDNYENALMSYMTRANRTLADIQAQDPEKFAEQQRFLKGLLDKRHLLSRVKIISNSSTGILSKLSPDQSKLYVMGHGFAGGDMIYDNVRGEGEGVSAGALAQRLSQEGLPQGYGDIRVLSCNSGDAVAPTSFDPPALERARYPSFGDIQLTLGMGWEALRPFAHSLSLALNERGFANTTVTGYQGSGMVSSLEPHGLQKAGNGEKRRRSELRRHF